MYLVKNTYGISSVIHPKVANLSSMGKLAGSSMDRKKYTKKYKDELEQLISKPLDFEETKKDEVKKLRSMSRRTKSKIRVKIIAFSRVHKNLSFLTLTFVNKVEDSLAVKVLHKFLDNCVKRSKDFQYLWVAEKQTQNEAFKDNIHFHIINNKFWKIDKWWPYWIQLQAKFGIVPRDASFKPTSAFNVKHVSSNNVKGIINYLTSYVTKNESEFGCQVWNCSKKISRLYTGHYSGLEFIHQFERLEAAGQLGGTIKTYKQDYANVNVIPLNRVTINFYSKVDNKNKQFWNNPESSEKIKETL
ncbi:rolling circle replication-associated protein [Ferruginibacter sp.]